MTDHFRKPRLLQMMLSTQQGGAETFFEKLALAFADFGIPQCLVIEPDVEREALFADYSNVEVVPIRFGGLTEWSARARLKRAFGGFSPDVALTWMNRASRRVPRGYCPVVGRLGGYYGLKYYRNCDYLIGITTDLVGHIRGNGWPESRSRLIPNFGEAAATVGDPAAARRRIRAELEVSADATLLLALGRLHEVKAHNVLIEALGRLKGAELMIAGEGPLEAELRALAERLHISERVHFLGWRRDIGDLFAACDLSVFPSRYEPNGTVVMESWAHGKPLVAARSKGPEWLIDDGENGLLFPIDDVTACATAIQRLIDDTELAERLVEGGRIKWQRSFSREAIVRQYLELFEQLRVK